MPPKGIAVTAFPQKHPKRLLATGFGQQSRGIAIETQDVTQQSPMPRTGQVGALSEEARQTIATVFQPGTCIGHREPHAGRLAPYSQQRQQAFKVRVGTVIEDNEPHIHGVIAMFAAHIHGIGVPAQLRFGLEHRDLMTGAEIPGRGQPGYATADNGDTLTHAPCSPACRCQASRAARNAVSTRCLTPSCGTSGGG